MRPFLVLWSSQAISLFGSRLVQFALIWWLTDQTGSATILAVSSLVALLPQALLGPFIGALVDRWNRKRVMLIADSTIAVLTLLLAVLYAMEIVQIWHILIVQFLRALGGMFHFAAMTASTTLMVPERHYTRIQGLNSSLQGVMNIASGPLAAFLLISMPINGILLIDAATAGLAILTLLFTTVPQPRREAESIEEQPSTVWQDLQAGFKYVWTWKGIRDIAIIATFINMLLTPAGSLLPVLVTNHFGGGAQEFGWMQSGFGFGIIAGGLLLSIWGGSKRKMQTSMAGIMLLGLLHIGIGFAPGSWFYPTLIAFLLMGSLNPIINGPILATLQSSVKPEMQGRVFTLIVSLATATTPIGLIIAGPLADRFGVQTWYVFGGLGCFALGIFAFLRRSIRELDQQAIQAESASDPIMSAAPIETTVLEDE
jgi:DHA3 family macrolide efflux protein-like MFS transporter